MGLSAAVATESESTRRRSVASSAVPKHVREIDGLRALAIWMVFAGHLLTTYRSSAASPGMHALFVVADHGWLGVDLFFVLSGFLITGILLKTRGRSTGAYFKQFYIRRAARILPLYFLVLLVLLALYQGQYGVYFAYCALMSANLAHLFPSIRIPDAAGPFWSLAVEEQFYLVWPWLVLWLASRSLKLVTIGLLIIEPVLRVVVPAPILFLPWFRCDGLAMGALIAIWFASWDGDRSRARTFALTILGVVVALTVAGLPFGILHDGIAGTALRITQGVLLFGAALVAAVAFSGNRSLAFLRSPVLATTALLSYCLYLIHKPLIDAFAHVVGPMPWFMALAPLPAFLIRAVVALGAAYTLAALSRKYLEAPFLRLAARH
jgi:peptidoglycan/LPS O-acetylase OafA/YrhL